MYYLSKFCRICVQTGVKLLDLDTLDFDEVKLSEKLEVCTKMVVSRESLSTEICIQCITKLRISYQFHDMCKKSTKTLQGYLEALLSTKEEKIKNSFVNTELNVTVIPVTKEVCTFYNQHNVDNDIIQNHKEKRKRITKEQRCSLLKQLLTPSDKFKKGRDKFLYKRSVYSNHYKGGLRNIIHFTKNYEFGCNVDKNFNYELTPLDKLTAFSNEFFRKDFSEFRNTILYIIENKDNLYDSGDSEEESFFNTPDEEEQDTKENIVKFEEVIVEPDIKIKTELEFEEEEGECLDNFQDVYVKSESDECKKEIEEQDMKNPSTNHQCSTFPIPMPSNCSDYMNSFGQINPVNTSMQLLNSFVGGYHHNNQRRTFSQTNVRCRTRDNPYINPLLKNQFLFRSFRCEKCNRYFKSPGYLKAHYSKVH